MGIPVNSLLERLLNSDRICEETWDESNVEQCNLFWAFWCLYGYNHVAKGLDLVRRLARNEYIIIQRCSLVFEPAWIIADVGI